MANTLRFTHRFDYLDDGTTIRTVPQKQTEVSTTSDIVHDTIQVVGTTHETISVGDATDSCYVIVENLHASATVSYGYDTTGSFTAIGTINAADPPAYLGRASALANLYLKSSSASTNVRVILAKIA